MRFSTLASIGLATLGSVCADQAASITRDVVVVGGGSSGTYTAVKLSDAGKSVVVIEPKDTLGGHAETYVDPATGTSINMGVVVFHNTSTVRDWFSRWGVELISSTGSSSDPTYVDFDTGKINTPPQPSETELSTAFQNYIIILEKYPYLREGFDLPYPVPADLLLPFGEFLIKNNLTALAYDAYIYAEGYISTANLTALYLLKNFGLPLITEIVSGGLLTTASHNTHQLYDAVEKDFGSNILLNTSVTKVNRNSNGGVQVTVTNTDGTVTTISAKKIVWTAPPTLSNLEGSGFDLTDNEKTLFGKFSASGYYTSILNNAGLPVGASLKSSSPDQPFELGNPSGPYTYTRIDGTNLTSCYYATSDPSPDTTVADCEVQEAIIYDLIRYKQQNGVGTPGSPSFASFKSHAPFNLKVSVADIRDKFYEKLYALQGTTNTFWNGAAWHTQDSSLLWAFTDSVVLPKILASL